MKQVSTNFLRTAIVLLGLSVLAVCIFGLPTLIRSEMEGDFDYGYLFIGLYLPAIPFFYALYQSLKLLGYIDKNQAFSENSVKAFKNIKISAIAISIMFAAGMPYIFYLANLDDAPGLAALGFVIIFASLVVGTFAAVLQKLVRNAVDIKSENDLTV